MGGKRGPVHSRSLSAWPWARGYIVNVTIAINVAMSIVPLFTQI